MSYREPSAGLLARVDELERQLHEVRDEQDRAQSGFFGKIAGAALRVEVEQTLPLELDAGQHDRLVEFLQRRFDAQGQFLSVGRSWHWTLMTARHQRDLAVSLLVRDGTTTVRAVERFKDLLRDCLAWAFLVGMPLGLALLTVLSPGRMGLLALWLGIGLVALLLVRATYTAVVRRRAGQLRVTVQELVRISAGHP